MTKRDMNETRFSDLAQAYGGDLRRWPASEVEAARAWAAAHRGSAEDALTEARVLDETLDASRAPAVSTALRDRVLASATAAGLKARRTWPAIKSWLWVGGAGWAAAAFAGVLYGANLGGQLAADTQVEAVLDQAAPAGLDDMDMFG